MHLFKSKSQKKSSDCFSIRKVRKHSNKIVDMIIDCQKYWIVGSLVFVSKNSRCHPDPVEWSVCLLALGKQPFLKIVLVNRIYDRFEELC